MFALVFTSLTKLGVIPVPEVQELEVDPEDEQEDEPSAWGSVQTTKALLTSLAGGVEPPPPLPPSKGGRVNCAKARPGASKQVPRTIFRFKLRIFASPYNDKWTSCFQGTDKEIGLSLERTAIGSSYPLIETHAINGPDWAVAGMAILVTEVRE